MFVLKRQQIIDAGGYCSDISLVNERQEAGFSADDCDGVVYPNGFDQAEARRVFLLAPEALYWLERRGLVPCVDLGWTPGETPWGDVRKMPHAPERIAVIKAHFDRGPVRVEFYRAERAKRLRGE